jgi:serine/threonine-protein kinase RsbT
MPPDDDTSTIGLPIRSDVDVLKARQYGNALSAPLRYTSLERTMIEIVISEIARNTELYAKNGYMTLKVVQDGCRRGILIVVEDEGPGILDLERAMQDGYSTSGGLGAGLPSARRLMDEFDIVSEIGKGTTITMTKWEQ